MSCEIYTTVKHIGLPKKTIRDISFFVLQYLRIDGDISIHFIGDKKMRTLNRVYRKKDYTTDVISFAITETAFPGVHNAQDLGDIFIATHQINRQARKNGISYKEELIRMLVHGILHLAGYDHIKKKDAKIMLPLQEKLVTKCI